MHIIAAAGCWTVTILEGMGTIVRRSLVQKQSYKRLEVLLIIISNSRSTANELKQHINHVVSFDEHLLAFIGRPRLSMIGEGRKPQTAFFRGKIFRYFAAYVHKFLGTLSHDVYHASPDLLYR